MVDNHESFRLHQKNYVDPKVSIKSSFLSFLSFLRVIGLERTRKAVRDTGRDIEKMEIAHRLGERGHRIVKERDRTSGQLVENREFEHIDNENEFEREWFSRAERLGLKNPHGNRFDTQADNVLATPTSYGRLRSQSQDPRQYAIEDAPSHHSSSSRRERRRK